MRVFKTWLVLLLILAAVGGYFLVLPKGPGRETFVEVPPGTGTVEIGRRLEVAGVVRSRWAFALLKAWKGGTLKAGEYRFERREMPLTVYERLRRGDVFTIAVVIPEGYNVFDVAGALQAAGLGPAAGFRRAAEQDTALIARWAPGATSLEGYLFPDTYRFGRHVTPDAVMAAMVRRFGQEVTRLGIPVGQVDRTVRMASLVEREVGSAGERPVVAGVFENRLRAGMPLQTDPAVQYASMLRGTWTGVIHQSELHSDSPYNTYAHPGLPPGPICNPGRAAMEAALHPAKTPFLYFVADSAGKTTFSATLAEHEANVRAMREGSAR